MNATTITLQLPYPVSANRYWATMVNRKTGRAITYLSADAKAYKRDVAKRAAIAGIKAPMTGWVSLSMTLHPPEPVDPGTRARRQGPMWHLLVRSIDIDNAVKVTLDAMQGAVYENDAQVVDLHIRRGMPVPDGALVVRVALADVAALTYDSSLDLFDEYPA